MSDTTNLLSTEELTPAAGSEAPPVRTRRRSAGSGLSGMLLPELQKLAGGLGISGVGRMRKGELISAIQDKQGGARNTDSAPHTAAAAPSQTHRDEQSRSNDDASPVESSRSEERSDRPRRRAMRGVGSPRSEDGGSQNDRSQNEQGSGHQGESGGDPRGSRSEGRERSDRSDRRDRNQRNDRNADRGERSDRNDRNADRNDRNDRSDRDSRGSERGGRNDRSDRNADRGPDRHDDDGDGNEFGGRRRRDRFRNRNRRGSSSSNRERDNRGSENEPQISEDDVLIPVAGIVDILDNYAFIRTTGYLAGSNDVYVSLSQVRKNGLRRGDAVTGAVRQPREGERQNKYNPLVRLDTINGMSPDQARERSEFHKLTPLYPQDRLQLETESHLLTSRVIDLVMPIGKGQRALIVSPPKAGKTMVLQSIANAITTNNPECHLMVVLVDERPEEVTDMQRSVKGEVIASTFDRPPQDHTTVAELSIERAKRLVELGADVVVLLDSITRLGRAYNLAAPTSGRILSGGVDSTALYPPKRFLGAARNIENGGSLTIIATALVETGSTMDTVIFEEFKGTGNAELKLDRKIADKRIFPAVDVDASGTRKEEILLSSEELAITFKLRKVLHALDPQQALDLLLDKLKKSRTNAEFLMQIQKTTPGGD